ncbi:Rad1/Rec1/Rad17 [Hysterangium stoloniferum]|nr:Rad1/Rec1/Rad17 [Hysterangium stoloniferum]
MLLQNPQKEQLEQSPNHSLNQVQVLIAAVHDVRPFATILRGLSFGSNATISIADAGLKVSVEDGKTLTGQAYIPMSMFDEFKYKRHTTDVSQEQDPDQERDQDSDNESDAEATFDIPINTLLECLNIFGTGFSVAVTDNKKRRKWKQGSDESDEETGLGRNKKTVPPKNNATIEQFFFSSGGKKTGMRMSYAGVGHPLVLILAEDASGPTTTCEIQTFDNDSSIELPFDNSQTAVKMILRSSWLRDAISELDPSCDILTFSFMPPSEPPPGSVNGNRKGPVKPTFRLSAEGTFGSTQMDYPNDREVLESFECLTPVKFRYRLSRIAYTLRALQSSTKTSLRIDHEGLISLQFMMATGGPNAFIEFRCQPLQDDL